MTGGRAIELRALDRESARDGASGALLVLPLGATEQHGPHLPVGTDALLVERVALDAAAAIGEEFRVVVAPTLWFGSSAHHLAFGGTLSLGTDTYLRVLLDLGRSAAASGFRRLFFLNGHGGNHELAQLAARDLALELPIAAAAGSWWAMAHRRLVEIGQGRVTNIPGHAGGFETSAMLAAAAELVARDLPARSDFPAPRTSFLPGYRGEFHGSWLAMDGYSDSPADASTELGAAFLAAAVEVVADDLRSFHRAAGQQLDG